MMDDSHPNAADPATLLADLYLDFSGPPPRAALSAALLGGRAPRDAGRIAAAGRLASRLAADARLGIARRRAAFGRSITRADPQNDPRTDPWLARLVADLALHRASAVARMASAHSMPSAIL
ncbi:hypothetical protein JL100_023295 [Skermanella mucosa]|uniref:hypothetical protein n=1 Tax=Skermanella mucosa TaxID=1789672 RepID=UPI001E3A66EA|nr:hypothetical protein [Skermanella mucosa]UEM19975.1 hypothetical protein JL100_023295 [Skermanella mucosa]